MNRFQNILLLCLMGAVGVVQAHEYDVSAQPNKSAGQSGSAVQDVVLQQNHIVRSDYVSVRAAPSPVPEPEGWAMYLLGVGCVVYQIKRRRNKSASWSIRKTSDLQE